MIVPRGSRPEQGNAPAPTPQASGDAAAAVPAAVFLGSLRSEVDEPDSVPEPFAELEALFDAILARWRRRALSAEQTGERLAVLRLRDESGIEWTLGPTSMRWYRRYPGGSWKMAAPPRRSTDALARSAARAAAELRDLGEHGPAGTALPAPAAPAPTAPAPAEQDEPLEIPEPVPHAPAAPVDQDARVPAAEVGARPSPAVDAAPEPIDQTAAAPPAPSSPRPGAGPAATVAPVDFGAGYGDDDFGSGYGDLPYGYAEHPVTDALPEPTPAPALADPTAPGAPAEKPTPSAPEPDEQAEELRLMLASLAEQTGIAVPGVSTDGAE